MVHKILMGMTVALVSAYIGTQTVVPALADEVADETWNTTLAVGLDFTDGNSETMLGNVSLGTERDFGNDRIGFVVEGSYGESRVDDDEGGSEKEPTSQNARSALSYKKEFNGSYAYVDNTVLHDNMADVDYREVVGMGLGIFLIKSAENEFAFEYGIGHLWEKVDGVHNNYPVLRIAERWVQEISATSRFWESAEYVPKPEGFDEYLVNAEVGTEAAMNSHMNLRVVLKDSYDSIPAPDAEKNDVALTASLVWKL
ncbi:MAG: DUF481 domain-containing protein [Kiritimatiellia bacterium]|nr:DUF481 domain-containing protein [Kiritimatiellia bacterium]MDP6848011.1 DUF481 domain-containing protein [Kiritimatiellia bacterium]